MTEFPTRFDFAAREPEIYGLWEQAGVFRANADGRREPYVIMIPPPNVTGSLHMGHALNNTLQDVLIRWKRMQGFEALWLPGTDHAGIATQFVVEKELKKEGKTRADLGREKLIERVWAWKEKYGNEILTQLRRLGASCDWSRTRFTMDEAYARAVRFAFVTLFKRGHVARDRKVINWCPACRTALSDIEVETRTSKGRLWTVKYPVVGGGFIRVATTRPETIVGDTGVAVHPEDPRWKEFIGRKAKLPVIGREVPIIADTFVDPKFGTGAVKITPAHDFNDFECAKRNGLPMLLAMNEDGTMNAEAGPFAGQDRYACRKNILERLQADELLEKEEDYELTQGFCYRSGTAIEPYLSWQWFVRMKALADPALEAVRSGRVKFHPERFARIYSEWLENIRDWCVSRQIWWGHRIPVWMCECGATASSMEDPEECPKCGSRKIAQDESVLDTWFSSMLWPFATLGWPEMTEDLEAFYPGHALVTARDIIFLWVARMVMGGYEFQGDAPFADVFINPTIQTIEGKRMSKSLGTGVDPLGLIDQFGADALRFGLTVQVSSAQDLRFAPDKIEQARNFMTKIWNAARFVSMNVPAEAMNAKGDLKTEDRWIRSACASVTGRVQGHLERFEFGEALQALWQFTWNEFCDWYIEMAKRRLQDPAAQSTLALVLTRVLKLMHPVMPFVSEELWQRLREQGWPLEEILASAVWPAADPREIDRALEDRMALVFEAVRGVRDVRQRANIGRGTALDAIACPKEEAARAALEAGAETIRFLANVEKFAIDANGERPRPAGTVVAERFVLYVPLEGKIDVAAERGRQETRKRKLAEQVAGVERKLGDAAFRSRAPADLVESEEERLAGLRAQLGEIDSALADLV